FFSSRRRHTRFSRDWSSDVCSSDLSCKDTFCHGGYFVGGRPSGGSLVTPNWLDLSGKPAECGSCHGLPPPSPHPDDSACADCHRSEERRVGKECRAMRTRRR